LGFTLWQVQLATAFLRLTAAIICVVHNLSLAQNSKRLNRRAMTVSEVMKYSVANATPLPSRIMLGGAVLNPDSAIRRQQLQAKSGPVVGPLLTGH
jgi:hypothetical protein